VLSSPRLAPEEWTLWERRNYIQRWHVLNVKMCGRNSLISLNRCPKVQFSVTGPCKIDFNSKSMTEEHHCRGPMWWEVNVWSYTIGWRRFSETCLLICGVVSTQAIIHLLILWCMQYTTSLYIDISWQIIHYNTFLQITLMDF